MSPEQLELDVDQDRLTASVSWNWRWRDQPAQTTFVWGRNRNAPGHTIDAYLFEAAIHLRQGHALFGRFERVQKDELFDSGPRGATGTVDVLPTALNGAYGKTPRSFMLFARVKII